MQRYARLFTVIALGAVLGACSAAPGPSASQPAAPEGATAADSRVTVGTFDFAESHVLGEIYAQALERNGVQVERAFRLSSREIVEPALEQGLVDLVPEYLGTALEFLNHGAGEATADPQRTHDRLRRAFLERGVMTLDFAPAKNRNEIAVLEETARRHELRRISDLAPVADQLVFGGPPECPERPYCLRGLTRVYGLQFGEFKSLDAGGPLTTAALEGGEVDVALLFSNDTSAAQKGIVFLDDDRALQPAENIVPVIRSDVVEQYGDALVQVLDRVTERISTEHLVPLIRGAEQGKSVPDLVSAWLDREGL